MFQLLPWEHVCLRSRDSATVAYICLFRGLCLTAGLYATLFACIRVFLSQMQLTVLSYFRTTTCFDRTRPSSGTRLSCRNCTSVCYNCISRVKLTLIFIKLYSELELKIGLKTS
jgi:hypothetical protein